MSHLTRLFLISIACILLLLTACKGSSEQKRVHYDNPYASTSQWYVTPWWSENVSTQGGAAIANESTFIWLEHIADVAPILEGDEALNSFPLIPTPRYGYSLEDHLEEALKQKADLIQLVLNNLPGKGCFFDNPMSELDATAEGIRTYKSAYIDNIIRILAKEKYAGISVVIALEPSALAGASALVEYTDTCERIANSKPWGYTEGIRYALTQFKTLSNVHVYLDIGQSWALSSPARLNMQAYFVKGVLEGFEQIQVQDIVDGFSENENTLKQGLIVKVFTDTAGPTPPPGWNSISGFVSNLAGYAPLKEPYLNDPEKLLPDTDAPLRSAQYYDWDTNFGQINFSNTWLSIITKVGGGNDLGMLIDSSRNGWGGVNRPTTLPSDDLSIEEYVNSARIDQRPHRGSYCNPVGAGIGERPQAVPQQNIDAFIWGVPVGLSDGSWSEPTEVEYLLSPYTKNHQWDGMCDPDGENRFAEAFEHTAQIGITTGAVDNSPPRGFWFDDGFKSLLENAYPPIK